MTSKVISAMSMSLDGYVTGPQAGREHPLGIGGEPLHEWIWDPSAQDTALLDEMVAGVGAIVMGRLSYDSNEGDGGWGDGRPAGKTPCLARRRRSRRCGPVCSTNSSYIWCRSCSATASGCSTCSAPTRYGWSGPG